MDILTNPDVTADKANIGTLGWFCKWKCHWCQYATLYGECAIKRADGTYLLNTNNAKRREKCKSS